MSVTGVLADETAQLITPVPALASQSAYYEAGVLCTGQAAGQLALQLHDGPQRGPDRIHRDSEPGIRRYFVAPDGVARTETKPDSIETI